MAVNKVSLPELAAALSTLSPDDRAYVERMASDFRPRRRRRRKSAMKNPARKMKKASAPKRSQKVKARKAATTGNGKAEGSSVDAALMRKRNRASQLSEGQ